MGSRLQLQTILETLLGSKNVYFQPPESMKLNYPCIIYKRDQLKTKFADDKPYTTQVRYSITVVDRDPDSVLPGKIAALPKCVYDRHYTAESLNHDIFTLYY